jgi:subtilisin-like proprotein convertase family protein
VFISQTIEIENCPFIEGVSVLLAFQHTRARDIAVDLFSPEDTKVRLMNGPCNDLFTNDTSTCNDFANFVASNPITFERNEGLDITTNLQTTGTGDTNDIVDEQTARVPELRNFAFEDPNGEWTLVVYDAEAGETGTVESFVLSIECQIIPPPPCRERLQSCDTDAQCCSGNCAFWGLCAFRTPNIWIYPLCLLFDSCPVPPTPSPSAPPTVVPSPTTAASPTPAPLPPSSPQQWSQCKPCAGLGNDPGREVKFTLLGSCVELCVQTSILYGLLAMECGPC